MNQSAKRPWNFLGAFTTLLLLHFLIQFHHFAIVYINSSFLGQFVSPERVSFIYIVASVFIIGALMVAPRIVTRVGVFPLFVITVPLLQISVFFLGFSTTAASVIFFFIVQAVLIFFLRYLLDLYLESLSKDESKTGNTRSLFITAGNIGVFLGPLIASVVIIGSLFSPLYALAAVVLAPVFFIALGPLRQITPHLPQQVNFLKSVKEIVQCKSNIRYVMIASFLMHLFNTVIIIYAPLYLFEIGGLSWQAIGSLVALALLPYLILEVPLGFLADHFFGEKEMMAIGLAIMGGAMALLTFTPLSLFLLWSVWFFITRIGGAMVEITTESYFFKQVTEEDVSTISAFRILWPFTGIVGPLIALVLLPFIGLDQLFAVFGALFLVGIPFVMKLVDSR